jgi:hypothetical protein
MKSINKKKFTNISDVLNTILKENNLSHIYALEEIKNKWAAFDKTIAAHSQPAEYDFNRGVLKIKVDNFIWKKEFLENIETLTLKIKNSFRTIKLKSIEII